MPPVFSKWGKFAQKRKTNNALNWVLTNGLLIFLLIHQGQTQSKQSSSFFLMTHLISDADVYVVRYTMLYKIWKTGMIKISKNLVWNNHAKPLMQMFEIALFPILEPCLLVRSNEGHFQNFFQFLEFGAIFSLKVI